MQTGQAPAETGDVTRGRVGWIAVVLEPDDPCEAAVRWAVLEAARRHLHVQVVLPDDHRHHVGCRKSFARAVSVARRTAPEVVLTATVIPGPVDRAGLAASVDAQLVVLPDASTHIAAAVTGAYCPVVVVPDLPSTPRPGRPRHSVDPYPVMVAVGPTTGSEVIEFAFAEAESQDAGLLAIRTWHDPLIDLGAPAGRQALRWDAANAEIRADLDHQLSLCRLAFPDVVAETLVVDDRCSDLLAAVALHARLLVFGRPTRGALLNSVAVSPALALSRRPPCPVTVVPPAEPAWPGWLPSRRVGVADLRG
ncbi:universal stress protein [Pseudonocardia sp. CA-107938]|uniref:universal stress protein n=1 Tax=Pseudonocardia sp. CA-107938 TaxID=3240021 RepID=UPI003D93B02F